MLLESVLPLLSSDLTPNRLEKLDIGSKVGMTTFALRCTEEVAHRMAIVPCVTHRPGRSSECPMASTDVPVTASKKEISLSIGGMTCGACVARIEKKLNALDGVEARVNLASERARVRMPPGTSPRASSNELSRPASQRRLSMTSPLLLTSPPRQTAECATSEGVWSSWVSCSCRSVTPPLRSGSSRHCVSPVGS